VIDHRPKPMRAIARKRGKESFVCSPGRVAAADVHDVIRAFKRGDV
jgi:hypothetical protein